MHIINETTITCISLIVIRIIKFVRSSISSTFLYRVAQGSYFVIKATPLPTKNNFLINTN